MQQHIPVNISIQRMNPKTGYVAVIRAYGNGKSSIGVDYCIRRDEMHVMYILSLLDKKVKEFYEVDPVLKIDQNLQEFQSIKELFYMIEFSGPFNNYEIYNNYEKISN